LLPYGIRSTNVEIVIGCTSKDTPVVILAEISCIEYSINESIRQYSNEEKRNEIHQSDKEVFSCHSWQDHCYLAFLMDGQMVATHFNNFPISINITATLAK